MSDTYEVKAALLAVKENCDLPVVVTYTFDSTGNLLTGGSIEAAVALAESLGADAVGMNCSLGPEQMADFVPRLLAATHLPVCVTPNAGLPVAVNGETSYPVGPGGVSRLGAALCRGGRRSARRLLRHHARAYALRFRRAARQAGASAQRAGAHGRLVPQNRRIRRAPASIGERINPTGKPRLKEAIRAGDFESSAARALRRRRAAPIFST